MKVTIPRLICEYSDLVLAVADDRNRDPVWERFYHIQMAMYLLSHASNNSINLKDSVHAYHMIFNVWQDLEDWWGPSCCSLSDPDSLFKSIPIDFLGSN
ncbi:MAG: hypothetical protein K6F82_06475 [Sphaerochaetaceae bacterium]|nr:hypothetical protein [Sphaerochaetaceae bacterium]